MTASEPVQFEFVERIERREPVAAVPPLRVVDLFCGAGGLSLGFELAGFRSALGIDCWAPAARTFAENHPTANVVIGDIAALPSASLVEEIGAEPGEIGIICGGPPCQGFSLAGKTLADDPRNFLYRHFLRAVEVLRPAWVVMENVPALLSHPEVADAIYNDFRCLHLGRRMRYQLAHAVVNAANFGVPQTRTRVIFVAKRSDVATREAFDLAKAMAPRFVEQPDIFGAPSYVTVEEAIADLPPILASEGADAMEYSGPARTGYQRLMRGEISLTEFFESKGVVLPIDPRPIQRSTVVYNHQAQKHNATLVERFKHIPPGGSKEDLRKKRPDLLPPEGHPNQGLTYGRLWWDRPAPTIPANYSRPSGNRSIHPGAPRLITPREAMRLSSFPDSYRLSGLMVAQREQVGNAVPPLLAFHLAAYIRRIWEQ